MKICACTYEYVHVNTCMHIYLCRYSKLQRQHSRIFNCAYTYKYFYFCIQMVKIATPALSLDAVQSKKAGMCIHIYIWMCRYACIHIHVYIFTHIRLYIYTYTRIYMVTCGHVYFNTHMYTNIFRYIYIYLYIRMYSYICIYICIFMCTDMYNT